MARSEGAGRFTLANFAKKKKIEMEAWSSHDPYNPHDRRPKGEVEWWRGCPMGGVQSNSYGVPLCEDNLTGTLYNDQLKITERAAGWKQRRITTRRLSW